MEPVTVGIIGIAAVFILLFLGMPIALACMLVGLSGITYLASWEAALPVVATTMWDAGSFYSYTVIPLFVIMGTFATNSGLTSELFNTFEKFLRRVPGGLGIATIAACAGFAAVSGSSVATAAAMGTIAIPEMKRYNYHPRLSTGCVAAGGTLGFLIPPSIGFIVYGMLTEQSIGKLLVAGIVPGIVLALTYASVVFFMVKMDPELAPMAPEPATWAEKFKALGGIWETIALFMLVIGGIYLGFFTPTEAAAVGATIMFFVALLKRRLGWPELVAGLQDSLRISCMVLFLVAGASMFSYFLALSTIPMEVATWASELTVSRYVIHIIIITIYLFLGCFLDAVSMMVLTMPVVFPVITALHFDPIWFGVVAVLMMEAGLITPPMGLNVFTVAGAVPEVPLETIYRGTLPFLLAIFVVAALLTVFPELATLLPRMMSS